MQPRWTSVRRDDRISYITYLCSCGKTRATPKTEREREDATQVKLQSVKDTSRPVMSEPNRLYARRERDAPCMQEKILHESWYEGWMKLPDQHYQGSTARRPSRGAHYTLSCSLTYNPTLQERPQRSQHIHLDGAHRERERSSASNLVSIRK